MHSQAIQFYIHVIQKQQKVKVHVYCSEKYKCFVGSFPSFFNYNILG